VETDLKERHSYRGVERSASILFRQNDSRTLPKEQQYNANANTAITSLAHQSPSFFVILLTKFVENIE